MNFRNSLLFLAVFINSTLSGQDDFAHTVLPILKANCAKCHTNGTYKGGFSLDNRQVILGSGMVVPGKVSESELIERIESTDDEFKMPPEGPRLSAKETATLKKWIAEGVDWETGFSFRKSEWKPPIQPVVVKLPAGDANPIDLLIGQYFSENNIPHPKPIDDALFLRRVQMDLLGILPTPAELSKFITDKAADKRIQKVTELLARNRDYADHWMSFWNDHLRNDYVGTGYIDGGRKQITAWLYQALVNNLPYDQFTRELIAPSADSEGFIRGIKWRGNVNASQVREVQFAQSVSQVFLGENLKCASCHDSFINDWKLTDAYGLAGIVADKPMEMFRCDKPTGKYAPVKFLWPQLGSIDASAPKAERLKQTANLITHQQNGRFTRTIANRIWKRMMGRGLVEPVDIMGNRPWNEDVLNYLGAYVAENDYDLKKLMKLIATSKIYQSHTVAIDRPADNKFIFKGPIARRLTAEQFIDSVWTLTGAKPGTNRGPIPQTNANKIPSGSIQSQWIWGYADSQNSPANEKIVFRSEIDLKKTPNQAFAVLSCDNAFEFRVNGKSLRKSLNWEKPERVELIQQLKQGRNLLEIVATNLGTSPNPAGLYFSLSIDKAWQTVKFEAMAGTESSPAVAVTHQKIWSAVEPRIVSLEQAPKTPRQNHRAALVISDSLMRSLGRPNREQIVTTRDDQLSTLQALDLSNGNILANYLNAGAQNLRDQFSDRDKMVQHVYLHALSRQPTQDELKIIEQILPSNPSTESVADFLWMIIMLPEFQHVR